MGTVFMHAAAAADIERMWVEFSMIDSLTVVEWKKTVREARLDMSLPRLRGRTDGRLLQAIQDEHRSLIDIAEQRCGEMLQGMTKPAAFLIAAADGTVIATNGQADLLRRMDAQHNLGVGTVFHLPETGINAITAARELEQWVYLSGREHDLRIFEKWGCFCSPIRSNGRIVGYLDLSFADEEDHVLFAAIFDLALRGIEDGLREQCPNARKESTMERLRQCQLTPRELEIGYLWLTNNSVRSIANELFLAEGTVRLVIKKIYKKTEVSDKRGFISKFI